MRIELRPITKENRKEALKLKVAPGQEGFIEDVSRCLYEAGKRKCWRPVGIYVGNTMVGFGMYGFFWEYLPFGRVWMDRLLIDQRYQGKGYGKKALACLLYRIRREYRCKKIYLSVIEGNDAAEAMYKKFGFRFTGKRDFHGEKIMVYQCPPHTARKRNR